MAKVGLFIGTERGYEVLKSLLKTKHQISGVLVLEQNKHELNNFTKKILGLCKKNNIKSRTTKRIKPKDYEKFLSLIKPDVVFVVSWRFLIYSACFNIPQYGIFILHDSLLPKYRGFSPTNWVIINGEKETGLSLQYINEQMDSGDIVDQIKIKIDKNETATTLNKKFIPLYSKIILKNIDLILKRKNKRKKQNEKLATYGARRNPTDGKIDFRNSTKNIFLLIKGLSYPYPGAFCFYKNEKIIVWEAEILNNPPIYRGRIPGKIIDMKNGTIDVLTADGVLIVKKIAMFKDPSNFVSPTDVFKSIGENLI